MAKMTALQEHNFQRRKKKDNEIAKLRALNKELYEALKALVNSTSQGAIDKYDIEDAKVALAKYEGKEIKDV